MIEKRKNPRVNIGLPATVQNNGVTAVSARTLDVSREGALIDSPIPLDQGDHVTLNVELEMSSIPPIDARVVRCTPAFWGRRHTVAVEFNQGNSSLMDIVNLVYHLREGHTKGNLRWLSHEDEVV